MSQIIYNVINITALIHISLKEQCHEIFDHFFGLKDSTLAPCEQAKTVSRTFSFSPKIFDRKVISIFF